MSSTQLGIRWTIGDVADAGFEALRLSILGAARCFGRAADYAVCVNSLTCAEARRRVGALAIEVQFRAVVRDDIPRDVCARIDAGMSQGTAWKLAPLRVFHDAHELSLDNDCILWRVPRAVRAWLEDPDPHATLLAEDVAACYGRFAALCGPHARNAGMRGLGPAFDLGGALIAVLDEVGVSLDSELDEQGLQVAALSRGRAPHVVELDEVTICSPVPPHRPAVGSCGAHFVGLNARAPWCFVDGQPITELVQQHWRALRPRVASHVAAEVAAP